MDSLVSDLMETDVVSVGETRTLEAVGRRLHEAGVGSVIVESSDGVPVGILTKRDLLRAIAESDRPLEDLEASEYMSRPLLTVAPDRPVRRAVRKMNEEGIEQLAIVEDYKVIGIIAQRDVIESYETLIKAAHRAERRPER